MKRKNINKKQEQKEVIKEKEVQDKKNLLKKEELIKNKKYNKKKELIGFLIIFCLSLIYFFIILDKDKFYEAHDLIFHSSNIIAIASELSFTNFLPNKILPDLVNNLGYGVNIFYPNLPHQIGAYIYKIVNDIPLTFKLLSLIIINLSGITMYKLVDKVFKNKKQALLSAITYISMPYLFAELFMRCALNESFLLFIIPLILLGIHYLIDDNNKLMFYFLFVLGYVLAINSHLVMSIYLTIVLGIYLLVQRKKVLKKEVIKNFVVASIFILLLTANFTVPLLEHHHLGIYNILNIEYEGQSLVQVANLINYFLPVKHSDVAMYIPPLITVILVYLLINLKKVTKEHKTVLIGMYVILGFSILLATVRPIWNLFPNILRNIQFGWRMSLFVIIAVSILFGYIVNLLKKDFQKIFIVNFIFIFAVTNLISSGLTKVKDADEQEYLNTTTDKIWTREYLPLDSVNNLLDIKVKGLDLINSQTEAKVEVITNNVPDMEFKVDNLNDELTLEFPRIYYLGYKLTDENGQSYKLVRSSSGLLEATVSKNENYKLEYTGTTLDRITYVITIISTILFLCYLCYLKYNNKRGEKDGDKQKSSGYRNSF